YSRPLADRMFRRALFSIFPYPRRLRIALAPLALWSSIRDVWPPVGGSSRSASSSHRDEPLTTDREVLTRLRARLTLAPRITWKSLNARVPVRTPARGARRLSLGLLP